MYPRPDTIFPSGTTGRLRTFIAAICCLLILLLVPASNAFAVQTHTGTEGLISHELGHFLFTLAMVILLIRLTRARLDGPGWTRFKIFLWLIILWNILTFSNHWMRESISANQYISAAGHTIAFKVNSFFDLLFYLTSLDHLLLVPAFSMLLLAIIEWSRMES
jgi:hypothetical protein